jgi:hypothetical protein
MPTVPVLSALTELLSGSVTEEFKKLLKPSMLVASAVFLTLNLVLILPVLRALGAGPVVALDQLSTAWQIALGTLLLFALAYVLNSLGGAFLALTSGACLRDSPIVGELLRKLQKRTYTRLCRTVKEGSTGQEGALATQRLAIEFPDEDALAPTRLGNVLAGTSAYIKNRYGVQLSTIWPFMDIVLQKEDTTLRDQLNENRDALIFLATLSSLLGIVAVELALVNLAASRPWQALWALAIVAVAYLTYGAGILKARAWGTDVCTAFELYLDKVGEKLSLVALEKTKWKDARDRWQGVSKWLAYGGSALTWPGYGTLAKAVEPTDGSWYPKPATPATTSLQYPDTVTVKRVLETEDFCTALVDSEKKAEKKTWAYNQVFNYCYAISNPETGEHARPADGVYLVVTDPRVLGKPQTTPGDLIHPLNYYGTPQTPPKDTICALPQPNPKEHSLLWYIGRVAPASCRLLRYETTVLRAKVTVEQGKIEVAKISASAPDKRLRIDFKLESNDDSAGNAKIKIVLLHGEKLVRAALLKPTNGDWEHVPLRVCSLEDAGGGTLTLPVPTTETFVILVYWK